MNFKIIKTLIKKDLKIFFKNKFFTIITILSLIFYLIIYFALPKIEDKFKIGIYSETPLSRIYLFLKSHDVVVYDTKSIEELRDIVKRGIVQFGVYFYDDSYESKKLKIFINANTEKEMKEAYEYIAKELFHTEFGNILNIESENEIVGVDLLGKPIPTAKRLVPIFAFFLIITETLSLANLISNEFENRTIYALLTTQVSISHIFLSKGVVGLITTFIPSIFFIILTIGFKEFPILLFILFLGSLFAVSIGFLIGSIANDMMSIIGYGFLLFIILMIPSFNILSPGSLTYLVKLIPSYFLVDSLHKVINFQSNLKELTINILILITTQSLFYLLTLFFLKRRFK